MCVDAVTAALYHEPSECYLSAGICGTEPAHAKFKWLWYRRQLMERPDTMSYGRGCGLASEGYRRNAGCTDILALTEKPVVTAQAIELFGRLRHALAPK